jgi:hypothetical protein
VRIALHYREREKYAVAPLRRASDYLRSVGIPVLDMGERDPEPQADLFFCIQQHFFTQKVLDSRTPTILLGRADSATSWCPGETKYPFVRKEIKIATLRDWSLNNISKGRYHSYILGARPGAAVAITREAAAKLTAGPCYAAFDRFKDWQQADGLQEAREFDCHFAGSVKYGGCDEITKHRRDLLAHLRTLGGRHYLVEGRGISREQYNASLRWSKVCVSPWVTASSAGEISKPSMRDLSW